MGEEKVTQLSDAFKKALEPIFGGQFPGRRSSGAPPVVGADGERTAEGDVDSHEFVDLVKAMVDYRGFAHTKRGQEVIEKALSESVNSEGGYTVPEGFMAKVIERKQQLIKLFPLVTKFPITGYSGKIPALSTDVAVFWSGENVKKTESEPVFAGETYTAHPCTAIVKISKYLLDDSGIDIRAYLQRLFAEAMAREEDKVVAIGSGSGQPEGIYSASGISAVSVGGAITYDKLVDIEHAVDERYRDKAVWLGHDTVFKYCRKIKDKNERPLWLRGNESPAGTIEGRSPDTLMGYPIVTQPGLPTSHLFFGDPTYYWTFMRQKATLEATDVGGEAFQRNQLWLKITERFDGFLALVAAFSVGTGITA